jgi:hypothetical protein
MPSDPLVIAGRTFQSRLIVGTGKYPSFPVMAQAHAASGADMVTVAVRRNSEPYRHWGPALRNNALVARGTARAHRPRGRENGERQRMAGASRGFRLRPRRQLSGASRGRGPAACATDGGTKSKSACPLPCLRGPLPRRHKRPNLTATKLEGGEFSVRVAALTAMPGTKTRADFAKR